MMENTQISNNRFRYIKSVCPYIIYYDHSCSCTTPFVLVKCEILQRNDFKINSTKDLIALHARLFSSLEEAEQNSTIKLNKRRETNESKYVIRK